MRWDVPKQKRHCAAYGGISHRVIIIQKQKDFVIDVGQVIYQHRHDRMRALRRAMRGEWYRASETLLRRDSLSDFNDGCKDFAELRALIVQARATAMNDGDPGPARRPNFDIVRDELVMA